MRLGEIYIYIYVYDNKLKTCDYNLSDVDITTGGVSQSKRKTTTTTQQTKLSTFLLSFLLFFISFNRYWLFFYSYSLGKWLLRNIYNVKHKTLILYICFPFHIKGPSRSNGIFRGVWWALVAQNGKNLPAMWETWVPSLGWEEPLDKGMAPL